MDISAYAQFFTVMLLFVLVLGLAWFSTRFIAGYQKTHNRGTNIEPLETYRLSQNQYVQIVRIGSKYVAIAVSKDSVEKLCDLTEDDIEVSESGNEPLPSGIAFKAVFDRIRLHGSGSDHSSD